jgi:hypothetical protein
VNIAKHGGSHKQSTTILGVGAKQKTYAVVLIKRIN